MRLVRVLSALALMLLACAAVEVPTPSLHPALEPVWRDYLALPEERALAIAGDPRRGRWVTGASGGHAAREDAVARALAACQQRRAARRMQAACVPYASGHEIVWRGR